MNCETLGCNKEATVHTKQVVGDLLITVHTCEEHRVLGANKDE